MKARVLGAAFMAAALMVFGAATASAQSLRDVITSAEAQLGGEVYDASRIGSLAEVELVSNGRLVDAILVFQTGELVESDVFGSTRRAARVERALDRAALTLVDAIDAALAAAPGDVLEAELLIAGRQAGRQFIVDIRTATGIVDVFVDASTGNIIRIVRD